MILIDTGKLDVSSHSWKELEYACLGRTGCLDDT